jgi:isoleucyl-tRNA synthetase
LKRINPPLADNTLIQKYMNFKKVDPKQNFAQMEEEILKFWDENKTFEKSLANRKDAPLYSFYDGPPFATGTPHYGHIVASLMKDAVPRYWTMRGNYIERKWGWDCHGLPIENIVEKELGIKRKKEIEELGVDKFNEACRSKVLGYVADWKKAVRRLGRWVDMENSYKTMDLSFMESVWWVFKELWGKGLVYEGYRSMLVCPRCETTLSQSEVAEGYKNIKDLSAIAKFELVDEPGTFVLAWTTTPWTLIGNVALAVGSDVIYVKIEKKDENVGGLARFILAKDLLKNIFDEDVYKIEEEFKGQELVGKKYKPLFDYYSKDEKLENRENGWKIYAGDFVTTEEGTGVVHMAPAFGEDDLQLGKKNNLPFVQHVGMDGVIKKEAGEFAGLNVKPSGDVQATDVEIIKYLAKNNLLFAKEKYAHSYPHCWRCETPLINYATSSWFVGVEKIKEKALKNAENINWTPAHIKEGRFGNWLQGARDWSISRQRYWASVMPIWKCQCGEIKVIGSVEELEKLSGEKITDIHKHIVDKITFKCEKCQGEMKRIPDVLDTWFDSGSMPYAQAHYPFENKEKFEKGFPAEFIAEGIDQTRCWFYYLHVISTGIKETQAFKNVIVNGIVLAEDGKKMSKRLNNYPDPMAVFEKYGADSLRFHLLSSPVMTAENLNFSEKEVSEIVRGMMRMLWNSYSFFVLYANIDKFEPIANSRQSEVNNLLDKWIISELNLLIKDVNENMESYQLSKATRCFPKFVDNLSNWYIRRSRKRFWKSEDDGDKKEAYQTLHYVLVELAKLLAPFCPFIAEEIYKNLTGEESVHLADFPVADEKLIDEKLNQEMEKARVIISEGLQLRAKAKIKVRQPLNKFSIFNPLSDGQFSKEIIEIIKDELNVKEIAEDCKKEDEMILDTEITEDLKLEGQAREVIRFIQEMRKEAGYEVDNRIKVGYVGMPEIFAGFGEMIKKEVLAEEMKEGELEKADLIKEVEMDGKNIKVYIIKL